MKYFSAGLDKQPLFHRKQAEFGMLCEINKVTTSYQERTVLCLLVTSIKFLEECWEHPRANKIASIKKSMNSILYGSETTTKFPKEFAYRDGVHYWQNTNHLPNYVLHTMSEQ